MNALVTGAGGFIGSRLCELLTKEGHDVTGVDAFTPYYDPRVKRSNVAGLAAAPGFRLVEADLRTADLDPLLAGVDVVFHQAGQPGVRVSWSDGFAVYSENNILVTQRLLEAARTASLRRLVYASSSSVYGNAVSYPTTEQDLPRPHSPYGVTKLAAEHLVALYAENWGLPTVSLRYFTVYGPRQRPDMATHRMIEAALSGRPFAVYGSGDQVRDFTFVDDVVRANIAVAAAEVTPGAVFNVAGGSSVTVNELINLVSDASGSEIHVRREAAQPGDVRRTGGSVAAIVGACGWEPKVDLKEGLARQAAWHRERREDPGSGGSD